MQFSPDGQQVHDVENQSNDMFGSLCNNVEEAVSRMNGSFQKMYLFHDELSKKNLPLSTLQKLTTVASELQANMSHLLIKTEKLIEKARVCAQPFELQCNTLTELRHKNDMKQRKLNIAVKKLEIMSGRNEQLERQRIVGKWEKLFLKCASFKQGNLGWRHTVEEYKSKIKKKENVGYLFCNLGSAESESDEQILDDPDDPLFDEEKDFHFSDDPDNDDEDFDRNATPSTQLDEELMFDSHVGEDSIFDWVSKNSADVRKSCDICFDELPPMTFAKYSRLSDYNDDGAPCPQDNYLSVPAQLPRLPLGGNSPEDTMVENITLQVNVPLLQSIPEAPETADAYTSTADIDTFFQLRLINPTWSQKDLLFCIVTFGEEVRKGFCQSRTPYDHDYSENTDVVPMPLEAGFCFDLESCAEDVLESEGLKNTGIRIALHEKPSSGMLAFTSVNTSGLNIFPEHKIKDANEKQSFYNELDLHFPQSNKSAKELKEMRLEVVCSVYEKKKQSHADASTGTMSYDELVHGIAVDDMKARMERCQSACVETDEKPIYTEEKYNEINEELMLFKERCAIGTDAATSPLLVYTDAIADNEYNSVQFFPRHSSCPARHVTFSEDTPEKPLRCKSTNPKMSAKSKRICEKLPEDFFARMNLFEEEKGKRHEHFKKEMIERNTVEICKRLEAEKKLCLPNGTALSNLPSAAFMPSKNNLVYKAKARSYLHPSNHPHSRTSQTPPSMLQLPDLRTIASPNKNLFALRLGIVESGK